MKHLYLSLLSLSLTIPSFAQQIPNSDMETWGDCIPWTSDNNTTAQGTTPAPWIVSNVRSKKLSSANQTIATKVDGRSGNAVKLENKHITVAFLGIDQTIPAYMGLGKTWSTSVGAKANNKDGGSFDGIQFTYRPDAISFYYKHSGSIQPSVVVYSWKGSVTQADVPGSIVLSGSPVKATMIDRDICVLDHSMDGKQGGAVTKSADFELISALEARMQATASDWTPATYEIPYKTSSTPEKMNIIFSADDYFSSSPTPDNILTLDDVKLLYYSRLSSIKINGTAIDNFNSENYEYDLTSINMPSDDAVEFTRLGNSGSSTVTIERNEENNTITLNVANIDADIDGKTTHSYVLKFKEKIEYGGLVYPGTVTIKPISGLSVEDMNISGEVHIIDNGDGTCTFVLPDFALDKTEASRIGDIVVENVNMTTSDGITSYTGSTTTPLHLNMGGTMDIYADVDITGTTQSDGSAHMVITVKWLTGYPDDTENYTQIDVEFNRIMRYGGTVYDGIVTIKPIEGLSDVDMNIDGYVHIINNGNGTCTFVLPDFALADDESAKIGDIIVENVTMTQVAGATSYYGETKGLELNMGGSMPIIANVIVEGTTDDAGKAAMKIHVKWLQSGDPNDETDALPIEVEFNGLRDVTGIDKIEADNTDKPVEYYNLQGIRFSADQLRPGIYIRRQGTEVSKILIK